MKREEDWLREACEQLAEEEADQLERSLSPEEARQAENIYRHHRRTARALIRRKGGRSSAGRYLRAAVLVALIGGAVYTALLASGRDQLRPAQPTMVVPSISGDRAVTALPEETAENPALFPAAEAADLQATPGAGLPAARLSDAPGPRDAEPIPTLSPTPEPTATPKAFAAHQPPVGWTGNYFPGLIPAPGSGAYQVTVYIEDGSVSTAYTAEQGGWEMRFTEYTSSVAVTVPENAEVTYVQISDGILALQTKTAAGIALTWDQEGQTLSLSVSGHPLDGGVLLTVAQSVEKVTANGG